MYGTDPAAASAAVYRDVLHRHGFAVADEDARRFRHPASRTVVTVTDAETPSVAIAAPVADSTQRYRWEIDLHGVPARILETALGAATADVAGAPDGT